MYFSAIQTVKCETTSKDAQQLIEFNAAAKILAHWRVSVIQCQTYLVWQVLSRAAGIRRSRASILRRYAVVRRFWQAHLAALVISKPAGKG